MCGDFVMLHLVREPIRTMLFCYKVAFHYKIVDNLEFDVLRLTLLDQFVAYNYLNFLVC